MPTTVYLFEARSIQSYLFEGGKLRDMIAASDQLDTLCRAPLDNVLKSLNLQEGKDIHFPRRSGGAIYAVLESHTMAEQLQALWSLYVRAHLPGVELVQVIESGDELISTMDNARHRLTSQRNRMSVQYPIPGPLVRRSPRTGKAAVTPFLHERNEWIDEATQAKTAYHNAAKQQRKEAKKQQADSDTQGLVGKFAPTLDEQYWPTNLELDGGDFPFIGQDRGIALVHADGNGLGELLRVLKTAADKKAKQTDDPEAYQTLFQQFSQGMEQACILAAQEATQILLEARESEDSKVPARPLVLGGDDLTIIIRADLAIPFATKFCQAFEAQTEEKFKQLFDELGRPEGLQRLTACAGICFIKSNQPFAQANQLAESLAKEAKAQSRHWRGRDTGIIPPSISFHQVSSALIEDADSVKKHEWTVSHQEAEYQLSLGCYGFEDGKNNLAILNSMAGLFGTDSLNRNALREVASLAKSNWALAEKRYIRWRDISIKNHKSQLQAFDEYLASLGCEASHAGLQQLFNAQGQSPLVDLLALTALPKTPTQEAQA